MFDLFGRLTLQAFKHNPIETYANMTMGLIGLIVIFLLTYYHRWAWLWKEWLTSLDPKRIGVMYLITVLLMFLKGFIEASMMRGQQSMATAPGAGFLTSEHFQQLFTAHGTTMVFFAGMGIVFGLMNLIVPLQIGARDVAFPFLNALSFWLFVAGALLVNASLAVGDFSGAGWVSYPPLSGIQYNPGVGVDYWIWSVQIAGIGSLLAGVNFLVTIFTMRCPGMTLMKAPIFIWTALSTAILVIFAFPILTATVAMLTLDRLCGAHFFTPDFGGNPMMYINLIWAWGHPEVYILVLPAFGIFSEVVATFSQKRLFGYISMVWAIISITFLSFIVWLHHFFTMGAGGNVNAFFGIMTMLIAIPTGVKIFNWLFTMYRGRVQFTAPMLWFLGFVLIFTLGGMAGVSLSIAPIDFQVHNSLFLIAHFHSMIIGGTLFGFFAGFSYWFPKIMGFTLHEGLGRAAFYFWFIGFCVAFFPLYLLGFMGATRRLDHYDPDLHWQPLFIVAAVGVVLILCGVICQILQLVVSSIQHEELRDVHGDPWNGRTLEWATSSPPPEYNFAIVPEAHDRDPFWVQKEQHASPQRRYEDIIVPKNSPLGCIMGVCAFIMGFGFIWHIFWLAIIAFLGFIACLVCRMWDDDTEHTITAEEVAHMEIKA